VNGAGDLVLWPVLEAVRTGAAAQLGLTGRPVCHFVIYQADHAMPADDCGCECPGGGQGAGWVRLLGATTQLPGVGALSNPAPCAGGRLLLSVEVGVHRCAPTLAEDATTIPDEEMDEFSAGMVLDLTALHRAFLCAPWLEDTAWQLITLITLGPLGGCAAAVAHAQLVRENCCPLTLTLSWTPSPGAMLAVQITATGFSQHGATLDFGDGSPLMSLAAAGTVTHLYPAAGSYTVTVTDRAWPSSRVSTLITVADHAPTATVFTGPADPWAVLLWLDEPTTSGYSVDWGDNTVPQLEPGQGSDPPDPRVGHSYTRAGRWTVAVTDIATRRVTTTVIDTGELGVRVSFAPDSAQPQVQVVGLAAGSTCEITLGAGDTVALVAPSSGQLTHTNPDPLPAGDHPLLIEEIVDGDVRRRATRSVTVPDQADPRLGLVVTWAPAAGGVGQTVTVQATGARVECTVSWGDGTTPSSLPVGGSVDHDYVLPVPGGGYLVWVSEVAAALPDGAVPRRATRLVGAPRYVGVPQLSARTPGAVVLHIAGVDGPTGADQYRIDWGDGTEPDEAGAVGAWYPARHVYAADGVYTITVDGPGMPDPVTRPVRVLRYPAPTALYPGLGVFPSEQLYPQEV
jgi:hypothetical protein